MGRDPVLLGGELRGCSYLRLSTLHTRVFPVECWDVQGTDRTPDIQDRPPKGAHLESRLCSSRLTPTEYWRPRGSFGSALFPWKVVGKDECLGFSLRIFLALKTTKVLNQF